MHILLDARALQAHVDGISRYSIGVTKALSEIKPGWNFSVIVNPKAAAHMSALPVELIKNSTVRFSPGENNKLVTLIESSRADCYLNYSMAGPCPSIPTIITLHDLMVISLAGYFGNNLLKNTIARLIFRNRLGKSVKHAAAISVPTNSTAIELQNTFVEYGLKAFVTGEGQDLFSIDEIPSSVRKDFLLYVGNARAYKNVTRLIVAYSRLKAMNPKFPELKMVVRKDRAFKNFMRDIEDCSATNSIEVLSGVSDDELRQLYRHCAGLVMPSLKEGFGLPALEAMAAGSPVIASRGTALEELVGDGGILVNPDSVEDIMHGMALLTSRPDLKRRFSVRALERAKLYSWEKTAAIIAERIEVITS